MLQEEDVVVATLFSLKNYHGYQPGTCLFLKGEQLNSNLANKELEARIIRDAETVLMNKTSVLQSYEDENLLAFVELIQPSIRLFIVGAGNDASPLVEIASAIGWKTIIIDGRLTHANKQRFPKADQIIVGDPLGAIKQCDIDERSFFVLMTHNYNYDLAILKLLLNENCAYIGTLGPRKRLQRMVADVRATGINIAEHQLSRIHGPTGLDIGAETAEEIALSVLGEILAVERGRNGSFLKERLDFIHAREESGGELSKMHRE
jgi:xanthine/CO dehydrogenase XdhC/CoxF family maturation factor